MILEIGYEPQLQRMNASDVEKRPGTYSLHKSQSSSLSTEDGGKWCARKSPSSARVASGRAVR
jgi:hypothetical protein